MRLPAILWSKAMDTKMSRSEKIVTGLAVALLVAGFATGVFAKPIHGSAHSSAVVTHFVQAQIVQAQASQID
jgi:hypothetical protein